MSIDIPIRYALREAGWCADISNRRSLSGGCIHAVEQLDLDDGHRIIAKVNAAHNIRMFETEAAGLRALGDTNTVLVPEPIAVTTHQGTAVLLMTAIQPGPGDTKAWRRFGEELAALHAVDVGSRYGFDTDSYLGTTPQPNQWCDDWVEFNAQYRLGHQLALIKQHKLMEPTEIAAIEAVMSMLDQLIPRKPKPALLHGDLWAGNAMPAIDAHGSQSRVNRIAMIDPACSIGDGWADIAMMKLFGGFDPSCYEAYAAQTEDREEIDRRLAVYQLYHVMNHITLFGRGYVGQAMMLAQQLQQAVSR